MASPCSTETWCLPSAIAVSASSAAFHPRIAPPARRWNGSRASWLGVTCSPSGRRRNWLVFAPVCRRALVNLATADRRSFVVTVEPVPDQGVVVLVEDVTERKLTEARVERMARFDALTGLANRFELGNVLGTAFQHRGPGFVLSLLYID